MILGCGRGEKWGRCGKCFEHLFTVGAMGSLEDTTRLGGNLDFKSEFGRCVEITDHGSFKGGGHEANSNI